MGYTLQYVSGISTYSPLAVLKNALAWKLHKKSNLSLRPFIKSDQPVTNLMAQNAVAPVVITELTKSYLHKLSDSELQEHFIKFSNKFAGALNNCLESELKVLQSYLRSITAEMSERMNANKK